MRQRFNQTLLRADLCISVNIQLYLLQWKDHTLKITKILLTSPLSNKFQQ